MKFYYNYFLHVEREHIICNRNRNHSCNVSFPEKGCVGDRRCCALWYCVENYCEDFVFVRNFCYLCTN